VAAVYQQRAKHVYDRCCTSRGCTIVYKAHVRQLFYQQRAGHMYGSCCSSSGKTVPLVCLSVTDAAILDFDAAEHAAFSAAL
jgi:hypothetical protein